MSALLFEIGTEELPPGEIDGAVDALALSVTRAFAAARLSHGAVTTYATPRRLTLRIDAIAACAETVEETLTGPAARIAFDDAGMPTKAALGFAAGKGLGPEALHRVTTPKGEYVAVTVRREGEDAATVATRALRNAFGEIPWKRAMRWGWETASFARPVHWLVALLGTAVLPVTFAGVDAGRTTFGHRFLAPGPIELADADAYVPALRGRFVEPSAADRRASILARAADAAAREGVTLIADEGLADEVKHLVEWPVALLGRFPAELLEVPREVLVTSMRSHQRYFAAEDAHGQLANVFVFISNMVVADPSVVIAGNLRVLLARLEDAKFFFREDRRHTLDDRLGRLESIRYIDGLGSLRDRARRIEALTAWLLDHLALADPATRKAAQRAATLAKADLTTGMVYEFPTLQGTMGRYYALLAGESPAVAAAIEEHYAPRGASDGAAASPAGRVVALADKLDSIAGCFAVGMVPSGSADPYALRRAALGIVRTCIDHGMALSLRDAFVEAVLRQPLAGVDHAAVTTACVEFVEGRLRAYLAAELPSDIADAVVATIGTDLPTAFERGRVLDRMRRDAAFEPLAAAYKRTVNLLRKADFDVPPVVDARLLTDGAERVLFEAATDATGATSAAVARGDFAAVAATLIALKDPIDAFFDGVLVNVDDEGVRRNRYALLRMLRGLFELLADLSRVQVGAQG